MRIGLVTWWFNRGQATVMRTIRHALDELGHETFVLAKPTAEDFELPNFVSSDDVWADHHHLTHASATSIPTDEYLAWASANDLDVALFFQNIDFDGINALSVSGVRTIGTYMWEAFGPDEAPQADAALDLIYAMHPASKTWFEELGLRNVPVVRFVSHPEVAAARVDQHRSGPVNFAFAAGYLRARKPLGAVVEAFRIGAAKDASLTIKAQTQIRPGDLLTFDSADDLSRRHKIAGGDLPADAFGDSRIHVVDDDLPQAAFLADMQSHDVLVGVSRWEGLGLHLFECEALGIPLLLNDMEPYSSFATDTGSIRLVESRVIGQRKNGTDVHEPDVDSLAAAFRDLSNRDRVDSLRRSRARPHAEQWREFVAEVGHLVAQ